MNQLFRRIYMIVLLFAVAVGLGMFIQFKFYEASIKAEIESSIGLEMEYMASEINRYFNQSVQSINSIEIFLQAVDEEDKILFYLEEQLKNTPSYLSLYFGTPENEMINGSGWIPPESFDLRIRPWYLKASQENKLITTSLYLNASKDNWIVTFAKPVYDLTGKFMGVVGGDNSLESLVYVMKEQKISKNGFAFFLDSDGKLIMHSQVESYDTDEANTDNILSQLDQSIQKKHDGISLTKFDGQEGYLAWNTIDETGWIVGNFAPLKDFIDPAKQQQIITWSTLTLAIVIIVLLFMVQRKYILKPLIALTDDIKNVSLDSQNAYRLPVEKSDTFREIRNAANHMLEDTQKYFERMTENKSALELSEQKNRAIIDVLPDLIFIYDAEGVFIDCLENDPEQLLIDKDFFIGKRVSEVMPGDIGTRAVESINRSIETGEMQYFEYRLDMPSGSEHYETRMMKINNDQVLAIVRDITQSKQYVEEIEKLSFYDQLTGLYNRRFYEEELRRLDTARNLPLTLVMLDVNGLKLTNDAFGHLAGDDLLVSVAKVLKRQCRSDEIIARIGGDEFVILLPNATSKEAEQIVLRIQKEVSETTIANIPVSVSMGWETKEHIYTPIMDIFVKAEDHMYRKKLTESQSMRNATIKVILETLNEANQVEKLHSDNVSVIGKNIAQAMGLSDGMINEVGLAGHMHDIGKIAINESLINKPGPLTEAEYVEVMKHPEIGYQILKSVDAYSGLAEYALSHHERWDGTGYPKGLKGEEIPLVSRIISVADAFEAIISERAYRPARTKAEAVKEIKRHAGTQFDKEIVAAFLLIYDK